MYKQIFIPILCAVLFLCSAQAQDGHPIPKAKDLLFYIQHNRGKNTYLYQVNKNPQGNIDMDEPIKISRQLFDNNAEVKPLTAIQRKFAYGIDWSSRDKSNMEFSLVSYPEQKLYLRSIDNQTYYIETTLNGIKMNVTNLFIAQRKGTSGLTTKVDYILFIGLNQQGKRVQTKLVPNG